MTDQTQVTPPAAQPGGGGNRLLILGGIGAIIILILIIVAAVLLIPRLFGAGGGAIASAMPPDTSVFVEVDATNLTGEHVTRIGAAFEDAFDAAEVEFDADDPVSLLEQIDEDLDDQVGMTIEENVLPWIGPNLGIGLIDLDFEALDEGEALQWVFAATVLDEEANDEFIEDLIDAIEDETDNDVDDDEHEGAVTYEVDSDFDDERVAFARSGDLFFLASSIDVLEDAIDAQNGENLADTEVYQGILDKLPDERAVTVFADGAMLDDMFATLEDDPSFGGFNADLLDAYDISSFAMTLSVIEQGIQLDSIVVYDGLSDEQQEMLDAQTDDIQTADFLPEETLVYVVGQRLDLSWEIAQDSLSSMDLDEDVEEAMDIFDDQFGFNPDSDLFPLLDGEYAFAFISSNDGLLAEQMDTDLGVVVMIGSSDSEELTNLAEDFNDGLGDQEFDVNDSEEDDFTTYEIEDPSGENIGAYGLSEDYLIVSTSVDDIENLFAGDPSLADSDAFQNVWDAFPRGTVPLLYVDLGNLLSELENTDPDVEEFNDLSPITFVAMGNNSDGNSGRSTIIFFVGE